MTTTIIRRFSWIERSFMVALGGVAGVFGCQGIVEESGIPFWMLLSELFVAVVFVVVGVRGVWRERR